MDLHRQGAGPVEGALEDMATGLTSPLSVGLLIATMGGSALEDAGAQAAERLTAGALDAGKVKAAAQAAQTLMSIGFTGQQVYGLAKTVPAIGEAVRSGNSQRAEYLATQALAQVPLALLGLHGVSKDLAALPGDVRALAGHTEVMPENEDAPVTPEDFSPERRALHAKIISDLLNGIAPAPEGERDAC